MPTANKKKIVVNVDPSETRVAVLEEERLVEIYVEREERNVGSIYKGRVANVLPGMSAAFVDMGMDRNAFLYLGDVVPRDLVEEDAIVSSPRKQAESLKTGQDVLVQITKSHIGTKGDRVTTRISLPGRYLVLMPSTDLIGVSRRISDEGERDRLRQIALRNRPAEMGVIIRTAAEGRSEREIAGDINFLATLWKKIRESARKMPAPALIHKEYGLIFRIVRDIFTADVTEFIIDALPEYEKVMDMVGLLSPRLKKRVRLYDGKAPLFGSLGIEEQIDDALKRKVWLKSGGYLIIEEVEALTVIDVNTGRYVGSKDLSHTILTNNLEAVKEIARQLRLRDIGGIIVIDLIDMDNESHRDRVVKAFEQALVDDKARTSISSISKLGLIEMTRKRVSKSLPEQLCETCPVCQGRGILLSSETVANRIERELRKATTEFESKKLMVKAHTGAVIKLLGQDGERIDRLEKSTGKEIYLRGSEQVSPESYKVEPERHSREKLFPVAVGQKISLTITALNPFHVEKGIGWVKGLLVEVDGAGSRVGEDLKVYIRDLERSLARADIAE